MEWIQTLTIVLSFFGMFLYLISRIDSLQKMIYSEMRDFHGRLCAIESEKNKKTKLK